MIELMELPPELLELVLEYLEPKDILNVSETCRRLNDIVNTSDKLTKKLTLYIKFPSSMSSFKCINRSKRRYRNLCLKRLRERATEGQLISLLNVLNFIGPNIRFLTINWCQLRNLELTTNLMDIITARRRMRVSDLHFNPNVSARAINPVREDLKDEFHKEFIEIVSTFTQLEKTIWNNVNLEKRTVMGELSSLDFSTLKDLEIQQCDAYIFDILASSTNLSSLKISDPFFTNNNRNPGIDNFEIFLMSQKELKSLEINSIQYPRLFHVDRSEAIEFRLNHLVLKNVFFKDKEHAEKFFKTQDELVSVDFQIQNEKVRSLDELNWYNNIIKTVLFRNQHLKTVNIEKNKYKIADCGFLQDLQNPNVKALTFNAVAEDKNAEFFKTLVQKLPCLKSIAYTSEDSEDNDGDVCFDKGTVLENAEHLVIINASVSSLINVYAENLQSFEYSPKLNGKFIDDYIGGFIHKHRTLKELKIGSKTGRSYFFVSFNLCQLIVNFLHQLESITIYNFAEVNKSAKLLCTLRNLKSLTLSSTQYQQFTAKTKVECERMKLKLIPVELNKCYEYSDC